MLDECCEATLSPGESPGASQLGRGLCTVQGWAGGETAQGPACSGSGHHRSSCPPSPGLPSAPGAGFRASTGQSFLTCDHQLQEIAGS